MRLYQQKGVHFDLGDKRNLSNIALKVGAATDTVTVTAATEQLTPVDSGEKSMVIGQKQLQDIAMVGQNAAEFIKILPGFAMAGGNANAASFNAPGAEHREWSGRQFLAEWACARRRWTSPPMARTPSILVATAGKRSTTSST